VRLRVRVRVRVRVCMCVCVGVNIPRPTMYTQHICKHTHVNHYKLNPLPSSMPACQISVSE